MIIACPSCGARFNLDPAKLLPAGRNVRCAKCDHRWRQMPGDAEGAPAVEAAALPPAPPPEPPAVPSIPEPLPPAPQPPQEPLPPEEAEDHPPSPPETAAEMAQSLAAIAEQVTGARGDDYTVRDAGAENPIARMARRVGPGSATGPITVPPRMRPMRPAKRNSHLGLILIAGLVIGLLVAGYVFRHVIARSVPGADVIYSLFGMSTDDPSASLDISVDDWKLEPGAEAGEKVFKLWGTVFNKSEYPMVLPALMVTPVDGAGSQMEPIKFRLQETKIEPGQNIKFLKSFENWPPSAPRFDINWAESG
ncbi:MAG: zinc-ribbon domain-containing protein [Dongiaceae bacterium]